jgi:hypothetical protein
MLTEPARPLRPRHDWRLLGVSFVTISENSWREASEPSNMINIDIHSFLSKSQNFITKSVKINKNQNAPYRLLP